MDGENRIMLYAGITALAAVVGTFVLWGPSTGTRPRRKGAVIGLQNLGLTCYLNSLLQAMASCHFFVEWLNNQRDGLGEVTTAMNTLINILCGETAPQPEEELFLSPVEVVNALHHSGWRITNSQQDVHELLCNLVSILEEEAYKSCVDLTISVNAVTENISRKNPPPRNCSKNRLSLVSKSAREQTEAECISIYDGVHDLEVGTNSLHGVDSSHVDLIKKSMKRLKSDGDVYARGDSFTKRQNLVEKATEMQQTFKNSIHTKMKNESFRKLRIAHDLNQSPKPSPFRGYITNKIECTKCNYKSALRYDKFDSISLHLPEQNNQSMHTLYQLLNNFVKNEVIGGITCEGCNKNRAPNTELIRAPAVKLSRFGKLPLCLCIHIARTSFHEYGMYKRQDYVDFSEYIFMDPYLHKIDKNIGQRNDENSVTIPDNEDFDIESWSTEAMNTSKHVYRLKAVIVHRGSHNDGHFMTYRRGTAFSKLQHRCSDSRDLTNASSPSM